MRSELKIIPVPDNNEIAQRWITRWSIASASTPGVVSVSLVLARKTESGIGRAVTHHLLLPVESAAEFMNELKTFLENAAAIRSLEQRAALPTDGPAVKSGWDSSGTNGGGDDSVGQSNPFELGAYGLFGN